VNNIYVNNIYTKKNEPKPNTNENSGTIHNSIGIMDSFLFLTRVAGVFIHFAFRKHVIVSVCVVGGIGEPDIWSYRMCPGDCAIPFH
jgi:hypothetical protein